VPLSGWGNEKEPSTVGFCTNTLGDRSKRVLVTAFYCAFRNLFRFAEAALFDMRGALLALPALYCLSSEIEASGYDRH
jgi:hypothetical protein